MEHLKPRKFTVAITGGIGSGKSYVCRLLEKRGIEVFDCDASAKRLMRGNERLKNAIMQLVGQEAYAGGVLQKHVLAEFLLKSEENKQALNDIVHPEVARDFEQSGCSWLESAILFDSRFNTRTHFDYVVCVSAPEETRINRIMKRDGITSEEAAEWIHKQLSQGDVEALSDAVIINDGNQNLDIQIDFLLDRIEEIRQTK